mmetsp:Transcript_63424/g.182015  ORF Transcript_63424/g.182015 Transcript_63424/m.182015 type:complete len:240 (+) Transcript_63424:681-1400(+)
MFILSFQVRSLGFLLPSSFTKKAGGRSSGGASLSLSAPSSCIMRCKFLIFLFFLRMSSSSSRCACSALTMASLYSSARSFASAASARAAAASASAKARSLFASSLSVSALSRMMRILSRSSRAVRASFWASLIARSDSFAFRFSSSKRRTCSATNSFAFSSSPKACASCADKISTWSSYRRLSSSRCRSARRSTVSSCKANMHFCNTLSSRHCWRAFKRRSHAAFLKRFWCSIFRRSLS